MADAQAPEPTMPTGHQAAQSQQALFERLMVRERTIEELNERRRFRAHVLLYVAINALLVAIWAIVSGVDSEFWPVYPMLFWGFAVLINAKDVYAPEPLGVLANLIFGPVSEQEIDHRMDRARH